MIQVMLDQEDYTELYQQWFNYENRFKKNINQIVGRVKVVETPYIKGNQYSEEYLVVWDRVPSITQRPSVIDPGTNRSHVTVV